MYICICVCRPRGTRVIQYQCEDSTDLDKCLHDILYSDKSGPIGSDTSKYVDSNTQVS